MNLNLIAEKIKQQLLELTQFNATPGKGVTRFPFTAEAKAATEYLKHLMEEAGLKAGLDNSGSLIGRLEGEVPETIMIGSHLDSVKNGGAYDGIAGVVCAIAIAKEIVENKIPLHYSLEIIATNDEEGARFHTGLFSGKVMFGQLSVEDIKNQKDADGISVYQAMEEYGLEPDKIQDNVRTDIKAFLEIHIEQGPVLEAAEKNIGIVDVIVGIQRTLVTIQGRADHAGTMPMNMRKDAMAMAAKAIAPLDERAKQYPNAVTTVGFVAIEPNVINIIPEKVTFAVDIRGVEETTIKGLNIALLEDLERLSKNMGMSYTAESLLYAEPVVMNEKIRSCYEDSCVKNAFPYMHLVSGAGHDAQIFGKEVPAAMLFVPSVAGRSHCPEEKSDEKNLAMAVKVAYDAVLQMNE